MILERTSRVRARRGKAGRAVSVGTIAFQVDVGDRLGTGERGS